MTDTGESHRNALGEDGAFDTGTSSEDELSPIRQERFERATRLLDWVRRTRMAKRLPDQFLKPLDYLANLIIQYNAYRHYAAGFRWDDEDVFSVSPTDHVHVPSLFIVELFPPSVIHNLERADRRNRWASRQVRMFPDGVPTLDEARSGERWSWWNHGALVRRGSNAFLMDASHGKMPTEFDSVKLKGLQIGQGVTAIMAKFNLSDAAVARLDEAWHRHYEPELDWGKWGGRWPRPLDREFAAYKRVQEERGRLHSVARQWFSEKCPGIFAINREPQPLVDVVLFDEISAYPDERPPRSVDAAVRSLGLESPVLVQRSAAFPAMVLCQFNIRSDSNMEDRRTWALWGNRSEIADGLSEPLSAYGLNPSDRSIAYYVQREFEDYFLRLSIGEMLKVCQSRYAAMRDAARQHGGQLERLRGTLLTLSIDMSSIDRDVRAYNSRGFRRDRATFFYEDAPFLVAEHDKHGFSSLEPINMNEYLVTDQSRMLDTLKAADDDYRNILTAAASLTSSIRSIRIAWAATWLALASLVVAAVTLLVTDVSRNSILGPIVDWLGLAH